MNSPPSQTVSVPSVSTEESQGLSSDSNPQVEEHISKFNGLKSENLNIEHLSHSILQSILYLKQLSPQFLAPADYHHVASQQITIGESKQDFIALDHETPFETVISNKSLVSSWLEWTFLIFNQIEMTKSLMLPLNIATEDLEKILITIDNCLFKVLHWVIQSIAPKGLSTIELLDWRFSNYKQRKILLSSFQSTRSLVLESFKQLSLPYPVTSYESWHLDIDISADNASFLLSLSRLTSSLHMESFDSKNSHILHLVNRILSQLDTDDKISSQFFDSVIPEAPPLPSDLVSNSGPRVSDLKFSMDFLNDESMDISEESEINSNLDSFISDEIADDQLPQKLSEIDQMRHSASNSSHPAHITPLSESNLNQDAILKQHQPPTRPDILNPPNPSPSDTKNTPSLVKSKVPRNSPQKSFSVRDPKSLTQSPLLNNSPVFHSQSFAYRSPLKNSEFNRPEMVERANPDNNQPQSIIEKVAGAEAPKSSISSKKSKLNLFKKSSSPNIKIQAKSNKFSQFPALAIPEIEFHHLKIPSPNTALLHQSQSSSIYNAFFGKKKVVVQVFAPIHKTKSKNVFKQTGSFVKKIFQTISEEHDIGASLVSLSSIVEKSKSNNAHHQLFHLVATEARILRFSKHPNLCRFIAMCPNPCAFVYNQCTGGTLQEHLYGNSNHANARPWLPRARIEISNQIISALSYLHRVGAVPYHITVQNILFQYDKSDFSQSRLEEWRIADKNFISPNEFPVETYSGLTAKITKYGSNFFFSNHNHVLNPRYASPEELTSPNHCLPTLVTVYRLGLLLAEIWTGYPCYYNMSGDVKIRSQVMNGNPSHDLSWIERVSPPLFRLISSCTHPDPSCRPALDHVVLSLWPFCKQQLESIASEFPQIPPHPHSYNEKEGLIVPQMDEVDAQTTIDGLDPSTLLLRFDADETEFAHSISEPRRHRSSHSYSDLHAPLDADVPTPSTVINTVQLNPEGLEATSILDAPSSEENQINQTMSKTLSQTISQPLIKTEANFPSTLHSNSDSNDTIDSSPPQASTSTKAPSPRPLPQKRMALVSHQRLYKIGSEKISYNRTSANFNSDSDVSLAYSMSDADLGLHAQSEEDSHNLKAKGHQESSSKSPSVMFIAALKHFLSDSVAENSQAFTLFMQAALLGHFPAMIAVAHFLSFGYNVVRVDNPKATKAWVCRAAAENDVAALVWVLRQWPDSLSKSKWKDRRKYLAQLEQRCIEGTSNAFEYTILADTYASNLVVRQNLKKAVFFYKKAALLGDSTAQSSLGYFYLHGTYVTKNPSQAVELFRNASKQGHCDAQGHLGGCYFSGEGVEQNLSVAASYWTQAAKQGSANALVNLGLCYQFGFGVDKDMKVAFRLYEKAYEQGHSFGAEKLAECYFDGLGCDQDRQKASELFDIAQEKVDQTQIRTLKTIASEAPQC